MFYVSYLRAPTVLRVGDFRCEKNCNIYEERKANAHQHQSRFLHGTGATVHKTPAVCVANWRQKMPINLN